MRLNSSNYHPQKIWTIDELRADVAEAAANFRKDRLEEPLEEYSDRFEEVRDQFENLFEQTLDLVRLEQEALDILSNRQKLDGLRYLAGPPISIDDLKTLAEVNSLTPNYLRGKPELVQSLMQTIRAGMDRHRFPWVTEGRLPTETETEKEAAIVASSALMATQKVATSRRTESKLFQENKVAEALRAHGLREVAIVGGVIRNSGSFPPEGTFCPKETTLTSRKADLIVRLWDGRIMPIECKVSNSAINSVKRLNNDAAVKAEVWRKDLGEWQVVPVAILSGVYKLHNVQQAQNRGLTIYWAHRLEDLLEWIEGTRPGNS